MDLETRYEELLEAKMHISRAEAFLEGAKYLRALANIEQELANDIYEEIKSQKEES